MSRLTLYDHLGLPKVRYPYLTEFEFMLKELQHYKDLEEQLEKLFGGKLPLKKVVDNLKRVAQNGEEKLDYARILTNAEAEKWDKWNDLEEQGRLIELPCKVGDTVWAISKMDGYVYKQFVINEPQAVVIKDLWNIKYFPTKEEAKKALAELGGKA